MSRFSISTATGKSSGISSTKNYRRRGSCTNWKFFHANDGRKDSLIFDLMDFFRQPVIDRFVLSLLNKKMIQPENFTSTPEEYRLTDDGRLIFCNRYEEYMAKKYREYGDKTSRDLINERVKKFSAYLNR